MIETLRDVNSKFSLARKKHSHWQLEGHVFGIFKVHSFNSKCVLFDRV